MFLKLFLYRWENSKLAVKCLLCITETWFFLEVSLTLEGYKNAEIQLGGGGDLGSLAGCCSDFPQSLKRRISLKSRNNSGKVHRMFATPPLSIQKPKEAGIKY